MDIFETDRLHLRPMDQRDEGIYCRLYTDPVIMRNVAEPLATDAAQRSFLIACRKQGSLPSRWILDEKQSHASIGLLGLTPDEDTAEIGVMLLHGWDGRGFATESMQGMVDRVFEARALARLIARQAVADNPPVLRLMTKLGFRKLPPDKPWSQLNWELRREEWHAARADAGGIAPGHRLESLLD